MGINVEQLVAGTDLIEVVRRSGVHLIHRGQTLVGKCPFHADDRLSFEVSSSGSKWSWRCGVCTEEGDALSYIQKRYRLEFSDALKYLQGGAQVSSDYTGRTVMIERAKRVYGEKMSERDRLYKTKMAFRLYWGSTRPLDKITAYLEASGVDIEAIGGVPECLRYHSCLEHPDRVSAPAILAQVSDVNGKFMAVSRTWLAQDGLALSDWRPCRMALGPLAGGSIQLYKPAEHLVVSISIEAGLQFRSMHPHLPVWAAITYANLPSLILPECVRKVTIVPDVAPGVQESDLKKLRNQILKAADEWKLNTSGLIVQTALPLAKREKERQTMNHAVGVM